MRITFLGTGTSQGVPVIGCQCEVCRSDDPRDKRLRSSVMIETADKRVIIDCGPDFRQQMLREKILSVDAIILTHGHKDHLGGLDDVRAFNYILKRPVDVYASASVQSDIRREFEYAFSEEKYPGVPEINLHLIENRPFFIGDLRVTPIRARHYDGQFVFGYRVGDLSYITDAVEIEEEELQQIAGSKVFVINALRKQKHYSHFNLDQALEILGKIRPEQGYLTHISHQMGLCKEVSKELPDNVRLAFDGLKVEL